MKGHIRQRSRGSWEIVLDIGSNDGTLLRSYSERRLGLMLVGMDPTAKKFREYYPDHVNVIENFFSAEAFQEQFGEKK